MKLSSILSIALGLALSWQSLQAEPTAPPRSGKYWVYLGTYTSAKGSKGIYRCELDVNSGALANLKLVAEMPNPTFLAISPNSKFLYAVSETVDLGEKKNEGGLHAFAIDAKTGDLTPLNKVLTGGGAPCHVHVNRTNRYVMCANYVGGSSAMFKLGDDGKIGERTHFRQHEGNSVNPGRQKGPHAHCSMFKADNSGEYAYVVDLGLDKVFSYKLDGDTLKPTAKGFVKLPDGCGPRHITFQKESGKAYVNGELDFTVITLRDYNNNGDLEMYGVDGLKPLSGSVLSTLPKDTPVEVRKKNSTAEVIVHPLGGVVMVSNRGHDSIALFKANADATEAIGHLTGGDGDRAIKTPRNFNVDPTGRWVLIGNQDGGSVIVAEWDRGSNNAKITGNKVSIAAAVCIKFLPKP